MKRLAAIAVLTLLLQGCFAMPSSGPVQVTGGDDTASNTGLYSDAKPPQPGESPTDIVQHFLDAMSATPIQTGVARQFLSASAQKGWDPTRQTIVYADASAPSGFIDVRVRLNDADRLDSRGSWRGPIPPTQLSFPMTLEDNEWRIDKAPDALIVPSSWFSQAFQEVSLYFFDPTGQILVPEPAFVPRGAQLASTLVQGLLRGPHEGLAHVERNYLGASGGRLMTVDVSPDGVADITLRGGTGVETPGDLDRAVDQLAWTLRQEPQIRVFRLSVNGEAVTLADGRSEFAVSDGAAVDPTGFQSSPDLYALRNGLLVHGPLGAQVPTGGGFGTSTYGASAMAVNLTGDVVAEVTGNRQAVLKGSPAGDHDRVEQVVSSATALLRPSWDFADRLWVIDQTAAGATVEIVSGRSLRSIQAPGIAGRNVRSFMVSRDGSRLVAIVAGKDTDHLLVSRILHDDQGRVLRLSRARDITAGIGQGVRLGDVAWRSPTTIVVALRLTDDLSQIRTLSVNGSPPQDDQFTATTISGAIAYLISSPVEAQTMYAVTSKGAYDITDRNQPMVPLDSRTLGITYVG